MLVIVAVGMEVAVLVAVDVTVAVGELVAVEAGEEVEVADKEAVAVWVAVCDGVELAAGVGLPEAVEVGVLVTEGVVVPVTGRGVSVGAGALLLEGVVGLFLPGQPVRRAENKRRGSSTKAPQKVMAGKWDGFELSFILKPSGGWVEWI